TRLLPSPFSFVSCGGDLGNKKTASMGGFIVSFQIFSVWLRGPATKENCRLSAGLLNVCQHS
ncbi:hypothetical protein, partial [Acetobacter orleanensis]|uniref:hypothetical protein n=1 Tax=Acetobacter orleanensis TaxID=104099 RepID=UPI001C5395B2